MDVERWMRAITVLTIKWALVAFLVTVDPNLEMKANVDSLLGPINIGVWSNLMLSVLEWTQAYDYFRNYPSDFLFVKITVIAVLFSNTVTTLAACAFCYIYSVIHFGDTASLHLLFWPAPVYLFSSGIAIGGVQIFLLNRYWSLTKNKCVSYAILLLIILAFGSMIYVAVASNEAQDKDAQHAITSILSMRVTGDAAMAIAFNLYLMYTKVEFKSSKKLIRRLSVLAFQTGSLTAMTEIIVLVCLLISPESNAFFTFGFGIGHVYSLTMLYNLNVRNKISRYDSMIDAESIAPTIIETQPGII